PIPSHPPKAAGEWRPPYEHHANRTEDRATPRCPSRVCRHRESRARSVRKARRREQIMRSVRILRACAGRRGVALAGTIGACLAVSAVAAFGATGAAPPPQVLNYQLYVGGKGKAKATLSPVTIGFINGQGG